MVELESYRRLVEAALEHSGGTHTFDDVVAAVKAGTMQAWPTPRSILITELVDFPRQRLCNVFLAAGDMKEIEALAPTLERWALAQGCTRAQLIGRRGWARTFLTRTGWRQSRLEILQKDL